MSKDVKEITYLIMHLQTLRGKIIVISQYSYGDKDRLIQKYNIL